MMRTSYSFFGSGDRHRGGQIGLEENPFCISFQAEYFI
jgi:hypothetical protein